MTVPFDRVLVEREAACDPLALRIIERCEGIPVQTIESGRRHIVRGGGSSRSLVLMRHRGAFVKSFPVPDDSFPCGEKYLLTVLNCTFSCTYCYLQSYLAHRNVVIYTNTEDLKRELARVLASHPPRRITTGELGDSLALDHLTGITSELLPLFENSGTLLELRTKSGRVDHLLEHLAHEGDARPCARNSGKRAPGGRAGRGRIVVTWTLGPAAMIRAQERGTASLDERLAAMSRTAREGLMVGVRFDPIIPFYADIDVYDRLIGRIADAMRHDSPHRFELGVMRFPAGLRDRIRERDPSSVLMRGEYVRDRDGKLRLYRPHRIAIYRALTRAIQRRFPDTPVELSMESGSVWEDSGLEPPVDVNFTE